MPLRNNINNKKMLNIIIFFKNKQIIKKIFLKINSVN